jgi:hypothetical protein
MNRPPPFGTARPSGVTRGLALTPYSFSEKYSLLRVFFVGGSVVAQDATLNPTNVIPSHFAESESAPLLNFKP